MGLNYQFIIENIHHQIRQEDHLGNLAAYIRELAEVDRPNQFMIYRYNAEQDNYRIKYFNYCARDIKWLSQIRLYRLIKIAGIL